MSKFKLPENKKIPEFEEETLKFWKENKIFEKSVEQRPADNQYVFYDGPPFISGLPHYGHLLGSISKDLIPRYWTMKGKRVERVWGWDAHGLTVENKVQKKLGIKNRREIEEFGLEKFTEECYKYTSEVSAEWGWYIDKIGRWADMENAYKTIDQNYMESVIWAFKELYEKGLIYEGIRTSLFCTTCGTPVSNFEIAMDNSYKDIEDPSVTVKFKIAGGDYKDAYILAWTTTPWTLPSNRALTVDETETYALVEFDNERYVVAKKRLEEAFSDKGYSVVEEFLGKELINLSYIPPYDFYKSNEKDFKIYSYEGMVNMEEGTGIVHSAPGFGDIDTEMGRYHGLTLMLTVDDEGKFISGDSDHNPFEKIFYAEANDLIREDLTKHNLMFKDERVMHRFPYHDRCDTLLIQKAQNSWFVNVAELKDQLLANNEHINWIPSHNKYGRFKKGIEQAPDWAISRNRFWATPMPVWRSEDGDSIVVSSIKELEGLSGQEVKDLHRPYIDEIVINRDGKEYKRIPEVLDSWFEAGSMPYAQIHYPFENKEKFDATFPGDYIAEYTGQVRAWFYVMHVLSTAIFGKSSFKNVIVTGVMAGNDGRKMSKTYQNYTDPAEILKNIGGDALRLYLMNSPLMLGSNANSDDNELKTKSNNVLNPLWNSTKFFLIYANQHNWIPKEYKSSDNILDQWIIARLNEAIKIFVTNMEAYIVPPAVQAIEDFVDDLSKWYVRRSRERISLGDDEALSTLYFVLTNFAKAAAPIIPFMSDLMYKHLVHDLDEEAKKSVHLCDYPEFEELEEADKKLIQNMSEDREKVSEALAQRDAASIKVRQPLGILETVSQVHYEDIVKDELNVKEIVLSENLDSNVRLDTTITPELKTEGIAREIIRKIQDLRKKQGLTVSDEIKAKYMQNSETQEAVRKFGEEIKQKVNAQELIPGDSFEIAKA